MPATQGDGGAPAFDADVLVVGAGPAGLSLAIELGSQGISCLVVERNPRVGFAPRAKTTNVRSRELMRRWGIAERLAAESPFGVDYAAEVVFATRLGGYELARFKNALHVKPDRDDRFAEHSQWIPQYKVEKVLQGRVGELPSAALEFGVALERFEQDAEGVTAWLSNVSEEEAQRARTTGVSNSLEAAGDAPPASEGELRRVRVRYLVGADGSRSTVRRALGIRMEGISPLSHHYNIVFRSPGLAERHKLGPALMYWLLNPELPVVTSPMDVDDRWTFGCHKLADQSEDPVKLIRTGLGLGPDLPVEVLSRDEWVAHQLIAKEYGQGRVFLVGDACHLHPPFGGYGMNMGIGDAVDLGWKLAAVLKGWGGPKLLQSYQTERRPVHRRVIDEAVVNHTASVVQLTLAGIEDEGPAGDAVRAAAHERILADKRREFDWLGVVLGVGYHDSPLVWAEPGEAHAAPDQDATTEYRPSARPGSRAPHAWLAEGKARGASLFDHFRADGFTLLALGTEGASAPAGVIEQAARELGVPLSVVAPGLPSLRGLYGADYALIRPDQHVAWRGSDLAEAAQALSRATGR